VYPSRTVTGWNAGAGAALFRTGAGMDTVRVDRLPPRTPLVPAAVAGPRVAEPGLGEGVG